MAKSPRTAEASSSVPKSFEPNAQYRVELTRTIEIGGHLIRPMHKVVLRGDAAERVRESIASAEKM